MNAEQIEQVRLFDWIRTRPDIEPYAFHIANERKSTPQAGYLLKRMGVKAGVSDLFIGIPKKEWHGLFLELKAGKNKPSDVQENFLMNMSSKGYYCIWAKGYEDAKQIIEDYMRL